MAMNIEKFINCKERCSDCPALVEGENGEWICDECEKSIYEVEICYEWENVNE